MSTPRINIIGSGKLGRTLIRLFTDHHLVTSGDFYNRRAEHSISAIEFCGDGRLCHSIQEMNDADIWLIATPDDAIADIATALADQNKPWSNKLIFHASGLHSSELLEPLKNRGAIVASAHPAHSFANPEHSIESFQGTTCTMEGDESAIKQLDVLFTQIGSSVIQIPAAGKALYHAATVMASNYLVALQQCAFELLEQVGFEQADASQIIQPLMAQSLHNTAQSDPVDALTGPIVRGDIQTLSTHLKVIAKLSPEHLVLYKTLGTAALNLAKNQHKLEDASLAEMAALFSLNE